MSTMRRGAIVLVLTSVAATLLLAQSGATALPATAHKVPNHVGPTKAAWFDITRATAATPGLPEPGVKPSELVVDGITATTGQLPVGVPGNVPTLQQVTALSALTYRIPKGATVSTLSLKLSGITTAKVDGPLPGGVAPVACRAIASFKKGPQQVGSKAPAYNCKKRTAIGQLSADKTAIQFPGIGRLVHGHTLSFVILPGTIGVERLVFTKPDKTSLHLLNFGDTTPTKPAPLPSEPPSSGNPPKSSTDPSGGTVPGTSVSLPPVNTQSVPKGGYGGASPQVAASSAPAPAAHVTAAKPLDDARARAAAIALLIGLVVATAWLSVTNRTQRPATEWGIGRFTSSRTGPPPTI